MPNGAAPAPTPSSPAGRGGLRGAAPRPLPSSLGTAAALAGAQERDRAAERAAPGTTAEEPVLLELPTRSYTMPEETEEERERKRQREMMRTLERFTYPGGLPEAAAKEAPSKGAAPEEEEEEAAPEGAAAQAAPPAEARARAEREAQRLQQGQERSRLKEAKQRLAQEVSKRFQNKKLENLKRLQNLWRTTEGAEVASSETVLPLIMLILQLNAQVINKWVFPKSNLIPPTALWEDVTTGCLDCSMCVSLLMNCLILIFPLALLAAIAASAANAWEALTTGLGALLKGLF